MCENENDLLQQWLTDIGKNSEMYREPVLDTNTVKLFKLICDAFEQNTHVFVLSLEVAENYLRAKDAVNQTIHDPILAAVTIIFICHKCEGGPECLKIKHVVDVLYYFTEKQYHSGDVTAMEGDVLVTLNGKVPVTTPLDDLDIIIEKYVGESKFCANVRPLCLRILEYVYIEKMNWFQELKEIYRENKEKTVFQNLISSKIYVPVSILIVALQLTHYRHIMDVEKIISDITKYTKIHGDHLRILVAKFMKTINL